MANGSADLRETVGKLLAFVVFEELGELGFEGGDFGAVAEFDVGVAGVMEGVVLVVGFGVVEALERVDLRDDGVGEGVRFVKLDDVG